MKKSSIAETRTVVAGRVRLMRACSRCLRNEIQSCWARNSNIDLKARL